MNPFDMAVMSFVTRLARHSPTFDELVLLVGGNTFLKGGIVVAVIWWIWFQDESPQKKREALLVGLIASFLGLTAARTLAHVIFRVRPFQDPQVSLRISFPFASFVNLEDWSSFPSDHAVLFFALATGIFFAGRRVGWLMFIYVSVVICLPRVYLGQHYPTDILAGAAMGVAFACLFNLPAIRRPATTWLLRWENSEPALFYPCFFLVTYQIAELFSPLRDVAKFFIHRHGTV